jgi:hypothetical protein
MALACWLAFAGSPLAAQPVAAAPDPIRIIVQGTGEQDGMVDLAAFSPDDRFLVTTGAAAHQVVVRDATTGAIINRIALPPAGPKDTIVLRSLVVDAGGQRALIGASDTTDSGPHPCRLVTYSVDLLTTRVLPSYTDAEPANCRVQPLGDPTPGVVARAHHGLLQLRTYLPNLGLWQKSGLFITDLQGRVLRDLGRPAQLLLQAAAMAADGRRIALMIDNSYDTGQSVEANLADLGAHRALPNAPLGVLAHHDSIRSLLRSR